MFKYYRSSAIVTVLALIAGFILGGLPGMVIIAILGVLETSLSFDNAVVNASVLKNWSHEWQQRFLMYGMPVAVFGMRFAFPLIIVAIVGHIGPVDALMLAINDPKHYETILTSVHHEIAAFGGSFLLMVFLKFFFDQEKELEWVKGIETALQKIGKLESAESWITMATILITSTFMPAAEQLAFVTAGVAGLMTYIAADGVGALVGGEDGEVGSRIIKEGMIGLMYLELLDASFSFDGVIGAFALTNNIFEMMLGLGVGAMFVRSMTLHLVDKGTLAEFRYLEHGAFWAIGVLAIIMFVGVRVEVPEVVTGLLGAAAIGAALWSSIKANRVEQALIS